MTEYTVSTNLISWVPAKRGIFGWPQDGPESAVVDAMRPGDTLVPKFSQTPDYRRAGGSQTKYVKGICDVLELDYEEEIRDYEGRVAGGIGAVPFIWTVTRSLPPNRDFPSDLPWSVVAVDQYDLRHPFSTSEFLRARVVPIEIARQFKATAAQGRRIQQLPDGATEALGHYGDEQEPRANALRRLLLVKARNGRGALDRMSQAGIEPERGDYLFLVQDEYMPGFHEVLWDDDDRLDAVDVGQPVALSAEALAQLIDRASRNAVSADGFRPGNARRAAQQLWEFAEVDDPVWEIDEFATFYDRFVNLPQKVSQALQIGDRTTTAYFTTEAPADEAAEDEDSEELERDSLLGLTVSTVQSNLEGVELPQRALAEAVTALRAGKHLLLSGPPGTGKSTLAAALSRAVVDDEFETATATADWTTFDTIGGYMPKDGGALEFEPGIVLKCLERGRWLVIDELNRADIDKAFGPLFTLLSGSGGGGGEDVTLPFRRAEKNIRIVWADRRDEASSPYAMTPTWRLIGTLNVRDKASLFQLSFAFLRRFAVIDVPLPDESSYRSLFERWVEKVDSDVRGELVDGAMQLAFGPRRLGPAILRDVANFTRMGLTATETASVSAAYEDAVVAFLTAVRLYAVPQYEGAVRSEVDDLLQRLRGVWPDPPEEPWGALGEALDDVGLS